MIIQWYSDYRPTIIIEHYFYVFLYPFVVQSAIAPWVTYVYPTRENQLKCPKAFLSVGSSLKDKKVNISKMPETIFLKFCDIVNASANFLCGQLIFHVLKRQLI